MEKAKKQSFFTKFKHSTNQKRQRAKKCSHAGDLVIKGVTLCCSGPYGATCKTECIEYLVDYIEKQSNLLDELKTTNAFLKSQLLNNPGTTINNNFYQQINMNILDEQSTNLARFALQGGHIYNAVIQFLENSPNEPTRNYLLAQGKSNDLSERVLFQGKVMNMLEESPKTLNSYEKEKFNNFLDQQYADIAKIAPHVGVELEKVD